MTGVNFVPAPGLVWDSEVRSIKLGYGSGVPSRTRGKWDVQVADVHGVW